MATPAKTEKQPRGSTRPAMSTPALGASGHLVLPGSNDPWDYMVSPMVLHCMSGFIVPQLAKVPRTPGLNGNGRDKTGQGAVAKQATMGFRAVPHDFECIAWGEQRASDFSNYIEQYREHDPDGKVIKTYHVEPWKRLRMLGHVMVTDFDAEGWLDFHKRLMDWLCPAGLDPAQIEAGTRELFRTIRNTSRRDDARGRASLQTLLVHVPREHAPADILSLMGATK